MPNEKDLNTLATSVYDKLSKAIEELVTLEITTTVTSDGTRGAKTAINMASGDITASYSDDMVATGADARALHDAAVTRGTEIFTRNVETLGKVLVMLSERLGIGR